MNDVIDITKWMEELAAKIKESFKERACFLGLGGSHQRGEATPQSDIDVIFVLDELSMEDLITYKGIISTMPHSEKACGFVCGTDELRSWPKYDVLSVCYGTKPIYGNLYDYVLPFDREDIKESIKIGAANLYHELCHRYLYGWGENKLDKLKAAYKTAFFILQSVYLYNNNEYIASRKELVKRLEGPDREILDICIKWESIKEDREQRPDYYLEKLLDWSRIILTKY